MKSRAKCLISNRQTVERKLQSKITIFAHTNLRRAEFYDDDCFFWRDLHINVYQLSRADFLLNFSIAQIEQQRIFELDAIVLCMHLVFVMQGVVEA